MVLNLNPMEMEIDRNKFTNREKELVGRISELQGAQDEIQHNLQELAKEYNDKMEKIKQKKTDPKLQERRIRQKAEEHNALVIPLQKRLRDLDSEKLNVSQQLNYIKGMKDYAIMSLDRYHEQLAKVSGPDHGVQLR
jgi:chromosome segregation ATPase